VENAELKRQVPAALFHICIDAASEGCEIFTIAGGEGFRAAVGYLGDAQNSLLLVVFEAIAAYDFGELAFGEAAHNVHLPEAVLGGDVALREETNLGDWRRQWWGTPCAFLMTITFCCRPGARRVSSSWGRAEWAMA